MKSFAWLQKLLAPLWPDAPSSSGQKGCDPPPAGAYAEDIVAACDLARRIAQDRHEPNGASPPSPALPASEEKPDPSVTLGAMFRDQGDFEHAVRLREAVLSRPESSAQLRARTFFELGRDYKVAGLLDRALSAYKNAKKAGYPERAVNEDLCRLYADSGDFASAANFAGETGNIPAKACYLVREAGEKAASRKDDEAERLLAKALALFPASPEARLAYSRMLLLGGKAEKALAEARLEGMSASGRLIFLEGLYAFCKGPSAPALKADDLGLLFSGLCGLLAALPPDITACYYAGLFRQAAGDDAGAELWFSKALVLDPDFWAARLALLSLAAAREDLPPLLAEQVAFFTQAAFRSKRFVCPPCGLRREAVFSQCPRCHTWHSAVFRLRLV